MRIFKYINILSIIVTLNSVSATTDNNGVHHYMYVSRDRELIEDLDFLNNSSFEGAQVMYTWKSLEKSKNQYDFQIIKNDIQLLKSKGKLLFIQIQDTTFSKSRHAVPDYLLTPDYDSGIAPQCNRNGDVNGWVSRRWNKKVRSRFHQLIKKLGEEFDGIIAGVNFQETAIEIENCKNPPLEYADIDYRNAIIENMNVLKRSFKKSVKMQYANFMPGEWLPGHDEGYLRSIYEHAAKNDIFIGVPDLMPKKKGMLNHSYRFMKEYANTLGKAIAVQDGNYHGSTGSDEIPEGELTNIVPNLYSYAIEQLKVKYIFWVKQEPYFTQQVVPFLREQKGSVQ